MLQINQAVKKKIIRVKFASIYSFDRVFFLFIFLENLVFIYFIKIIIEETMAQR